MTTQPVGAFRVSHFERANAARQQPGKWTHVRSFADFKVADDARRHICTGTWTAYQPPGAYQARIVQGPWAWPYRPWTVYTRYIGRKEA